MVDPVIKTERLIMRPWKEEDLDSFARLNADPRVMEFFPGVLTQEESDQFAKRICIAMKQQGPFWTMSIYPFWPSRPGETMWELKTFPTSRVSSPFVTGKASRSPSPTPGHKTPQANTRSGSALNMRATSHPTADESSYRIGITDRLKDRES